MGFKNLLGKYDICAYKLLLVLTEWHHWHISVLFHQSDMTPSRYKSDQPINSYARISYFSFFEVGNGTSWSKWFMLKPLLLCQRENGKDSKESKFVFHQMMRNGPKISFVILKWKIFFKVFQPILIKKTHFRTSTNLILLVDDRIRLI